MIKACDSASWQLRLVYWPNPAEPDYAICVADCPADALETVSFPMEEPKRGMSYMALHAASHCAFFLRFINGLTSSGCSSALGCRFLLPEEAAVKHLPDGSEVATITSREEKLQTYLSRRGMWWPKQL